MTPGNNRFIYKFTISDSLTDEYGHVNNARYLDLYEDARWKILESSGLGEDVIKTNKIGPVILEVTVRFSRELLPGDEITIHTSSRRKNDLIFYFDQVMKNSKGEIASKAIFTAALFDLEKRRMVRADEDWLKAFGF
jgi:YbgC/YbaW family acyl-CoA thioester hydrolase